MLHLDGGGSAWPAVVFYLALWVPNHKREKMKNIPLMTLVLTILAWGVSLNMTHAAWRGLCDGATIYVYIPNDGLRPSLSLRREDKIYVFPTTGVSEGTICEVVGSKPGCLQK